jgi:hypothetical protein
VLVTAIGKIFAAIIAVLSSRSGGLIIFYQKIPERLKKSGYFWRTNFLNPFPGKL